MTDAEMADLLERCGHRLARCYTLERREEQKIRAVGDGEKADSLFEKAEDTRDLMKECRSTAHRLRIAS